MSDPQGAPPATEVTLRVLRLEHARDLELPEIASEGSAGMDLRAAIDDDRPLVLEPGERAAVPTGLALAIPSGWEGQVRPRSGLALRHGLALVNSPGTIDSDYRGEVKVLLVNLGQQAVSLRRGQRIAQLVVGRCPRVRLLEVAALDDTDRGDGGFGSTGQV